MKILAIHPRQSGKTTKAIYEFNKDPHGTLFLCHNDRMVKHIRTNFNLSHKNIIIVNKVIRGEIRLQGFRRIIIDEYLFLSLKEKKELYKALLNFGREINIFTTADKTYDEVLINRIKAFDKQIISSDEISVVLYKKYGVKYNIDEIDELYYNFITDNDCYITTDVNYETKETYRDFMGDEIYDLYVLNKFFK